MIQIRGLDFKDLHPNTPPHIHPSKCAIKKTTKLTFGLGLRDMFGK